MFTSGGHSGNLIVIGIPSMRILKNVAVFTPEAWQGYGFGETGIEEMLDEGNVRRRRRSAWATRITPR